MSFQAKWDYEDYLNPLDLDIFDLKFQQHSLLLDQKEDFFHTNQIPLTDNGIPPLSSELVAVRDLSTGEILPEFKHVFHNSCLSAKSSTSFSRKPEIPTNHGGIQSMLTLPFQPAGFQQKQDDIPDSKLNINSAGEIPLKTKCLKLQFEGVPFPSNEPGMFKILPDESILEKILQNGTKTESLVAEEVSGSLEKKNDSSLDFVGDTVQFRQTKTNASSAKLIEKLTKKKAPSTSQKRKYAILVNVNELVTDHISNPAFVWPFELDMFQKQAIFHLEKRESVLVAAHTSAGKTVVAEYAVAMCLRNGSKAIYTSPIKALSNQKYREFKKKFKDVGLVTGDVQIDMKASCLIMTTEILRSMLYSGSECIRDLEWVIFDEVHYINDSDRGVVWEEVLIMLPSYVGVILLSATVPNTVEFADWVGCIKSRPIYVISTLNRPVPLEHYLYTGTSRNTMDQLFLIVNESRIFNIPGHRQAIAAKEPKGPSVVPPKKDAAARGGGRGRGGPPRGAASVRGPAGSGSRGGDSQSQAKKDKTMLLGMIEMLDKSDRLPAVMFIFSKAKIQYHVSHLDSIDLLTKKQKNCVHIFFTKSINRLRPEDRLIPQVVQIGNLVSRGLAVHHSGILPILKEIVELLFQRGLVKILFATETFAMGVNMPTRTVVFDSLEKFDGNKKRSLYPGEYTQMAGRAGRRGLDTTGTVIILVKGDTVPAQAELQRIILGQATKLESQFRLTYTMILNLHKASELKIQDMMRRSFIEAGEMSQFDTTSSRLKELKGLLSEDTSSDCYRCEKDIQPYHQSCQRYRLLRSEVNDIISNIQNNRLMIPGRILLLKPNTKGLPVSVHHKRVPAVLVDYNKDTKKYSVLVLKSNAIVDDMKTRRTSQVDPCSFPSTVIRPNSQPIWIPEGDDEYTTALISLTLDDIDRICVTTIPKLNSVDILDDFKQRKCHRADNEPVSTSLALAERELLSISKMGGERLSSNAQPYAWANLEKELKLKTSFEIDRVTSFMELEGSLEAYHPSCLSCPHLGSHLALVEARSSALDEFTLLTHRLSDDHLALLPEYNQRVNVLKALGYLGVKGNVKLKGFAACEMGVHEIVLTELITQGLLVNQGPEEVAALLSPFVFDQKSRDMTQEDWMKHLAEEGIKLPVAELLEIAHSVIDVQRIEGVPDSASDIASCLNLGLVAVVYRWAQRVPFIELTSMTDVEEGVLVRAIQRLDELLRHVKAVAKLLGDPRLEDTALQASQLIHRDIVFAPSLYLTMSEDID